MKFCDKLSKLRKDNNFSQEQLAEKLGLSRQAISKWELGASYPDMEKMIQMCNLFNCTLEDLMDDGVIKENVETSNKSNFTKYFNDLLKFITNSYNMFCAMKWKDRIKCLFEMIFIIMIMLLAGSIIFNFASGITSNLFNIMPYEISDYFCILFDTIFMLIVVILEIIVFIHLFKIRYLDYYITVEDKNVKSKTIEEPIEKIENSNYVEPKKEKIIIRDPKHTSFSFFSGLGKCILWLVKLLTIFISIPAIIFFLCLIIIAIISVCHFTYGIVFIYIALAIIGALLLNYVFLELLFDFVVNHKPMILKIFLMIIGGLLVCGIGSGLTAYEIMQFEYSDNPTNVIYKTDTKDIKIYPNTVLHGLLSPYYTEYIIDNSLEDKAIIEISYVKGIGYNYFPENDSSEYYLYIKDYSFLDFYKYILKDIKDKIIRDYDFGSFVQAKIYISEENRDLIKKNLNIMTNDTDLDDFVDIDND